MKMLVTIVEFIKPMQLHWLNELHYCHKHFTLRTLVAFPPL